MNSILYRHCKWLPPARTPHISYMPYGMSLSELADASGGHRTFNQWQRRKGAKSWRHSFLSSLARHALKHGEENAPLLLAVHSHTHSHTHTHTHTFTHPECAHTFFHSWAFTMYSFQVFSNKNHSLIFISSDYFRSFHIFPFLCNFLSITIIYFMIWSFHCFCTEI